MKHVIFGLFSLAILTAALTLILSIEGSSTRQQELEEKLKKSMVAALKDAKEEEGMISDDEEFLADFCQLLLEEIDMGNEDSPDENQKIRVEIAGLDHEKGLLCARATEEYSYPGGKIASVTAEATVLFDTTGNRKTHTVTIRNSDGSLWKRYCIREGNCCPTPDLSNYEKRNPGVRNLIACGPETESSEDAADRSETPAGEIKISLADSAFWEEFSQTPITGDWIFTPQEGRMP